VARVLIARFGSTRGGWSEVSRHPPSCPRTSGSDEGRRQDGIRVVPVGYRRQPGQRRRGFAVGLTSHVIPRIGALFWIAERTFDEQPTIEDVRTLRGWRWPVFFPLGAALRRQLVHPIGVVPIPADLDSVPTFRGRARSLGWKSVTYDEDGTERVLARPVDPHQPISQVVNDTKLKEMIVSGWRPERDW
jgi:hypothetical protein